MSRLPGLKDGRLRDVGPLRHGALAQALEALNGDGAETRVVGGAVRDLALGVKVDDFDLATTARPDEIIRRARAAGFKVRPPPPASWRWPERTRSSRPNERRMVRAFL